MKKHDRDKKHFLPDKTAAPGGAIEIYRAPDGQIALDVRIGEETVWLNLGQMVELFGRDKSVISRHLWNVFHSKELNRDSVVAKYATTAVELYFLMAKPK